MTKSLATKKRTFSPAQHAYMLAKAYFDTCHAAHSSQYDVINAEATRLGIEFEYVAILPEEHPLMIKAQQLLDRENAARKLMYQAAYNLFDWASETTLTKIGTPAQKESIRKAVTEVKTMAHVEPFFEELVNISMKLAA